MERPTLAQLEVFRAVADAGTFSEAARRLGCTQSAVSYAIATLEGALGVALFDREGRRPALTDAGRVLLSDARAVDRQVERLIGRAASLNARVEAELAVVVDVMFPTDRLVDALRETLTRFPEVGVRIRTEALGVVPEVVLVGDADLGICPPPDVPEALDARPVGAIELVPVAAPAHPLGEQRELSLDDLLPHVQIVLSARPAGASGPDRGVFSARTWRVGDLGLRRELVLAGFGWAAMPRHTVAADLEAGRLVPLAIAGWDKPRRLGVVAVTRKASPPGPAGRDLLDRLA
jgi:DNA-binding transcriptional LysR family regulator